MEVYLVYTDRDPRRDEYLSCIKGKKIKPLCCRNQATLNLLQSNTSGIRITHLPVYVCCQEEQRWTVPCFQAGQSEFKLPAWM